MVNVQIDFYYVISARLYNNAEYSDRLPLIISLQIKAAIWSASYRAIAPPLQPR